MIAHLDKHSFCPRGLFTQETVVGKPQNRSKFYNSKRFVIRLGHGAQGYRDTPSTSWACKTFLVGILTM